jgi:hypothetical protein
VLQASRIRCGCEETVKRPDDHDRELSDDWLPCLLFDVVRSLFGCALLIQAFLRPAPGPKAAAQQAVSIQLSRESVRNASCGVQIATTSLGIEA